MKSKPKKRKIDKEWFVAQIKSSGMVSARYLASKLIGKTGKPLPHASVNRLLNDKRQLQLDEAQQLARLFGVSLTEVLSRAGLDVEDVDSNANQIQERRLTAAIDALAFIQSVAARALDDLRYGQGFKKTAHTRRTE